MRASSRRMWGVVVAVAIASLFVFASYNRGQLVRLDFGLGEITLDAVFAIYLGICVGLLAMFLLGLPADLASRAERERLTRRVQQLERSRSEPSAWDPEPD